MSGPNPTTSIFDACVANFYNATVPRQVVDRQLVDQQLVDQQLVDRHFVDFLQRRPPRFVDPDAVFDAVLTPFLMPFLTPFLIPLGRIA
jgi:hypothetical protein